MTLLLLSAGEINQMPDVIIHKVTHPEDLKAMEGAVNRLSPVCLRCLGKIDETKRLAVKWCHECWALFMSVMDIGVQAYYRVNFIKTMQRNDTRQWNRTLLKCLQANGVRV